MPDAPSPTRTAVIGATASPTLKLTQGLRRLDQWATRERLRTYAFMLLIAYGFGALTWVFSMRGDVDPLGKPFGGDFIIFYAASSLALKAKAVLAYSPAVLLAAEQGAIPASKGLFLWCYPPTFQLLILPLALAPYKAAFAAWIAATFALYLAMVRLISKDCWALLLACAFPAVFINAIQGQNGFLSAAVLGAGLLLLDRRPWLAGLILGVLVYKPHFGVLVPVLLIATARWRSLAAAAAASLALIGAATLAFGWACWRSFLHVLPTVSRNLANGALPLPKDPSLFATLRLLGAPEPLALGANLTLGAIVALLTVTAWRAPGPLPLKAGLAVLATLIASPYAFDYDLVLLAIPLGVLAQHARAHPLPSGGRSLLVMSFVAPALLSPIAFLAHLQLVPMVLLACYGLLWRVLKQMGADVCDVSTDLAMQPA